MAIGDITAPTISVDGKQVTISIEGMNGTLITAIEAGKTCTLNCTSEGYTGTTLGTTARSEECYFVSASGASPASIVLAPIKPIHNDDVSVTFDADVAAFNDGSNTSTAASAVAATNSSTLDYPLVMARIAGFVDSSNALLPAYSELTGTIDAEAVAFGAYSNGLSVAAVKFELFDGVTTLTQTITSMSRSSYNPERFYDACLAAGIIDNDPYADNGGGSGVFKASFDTTTLVDGAATLTVTAYPVIGDLASVRTITWDAYINNTASLTTSTLYIDSRASVPHGGVTGTFTAGEACTSGTSGAEFRFRYESAGVFYFSAMDSKALVSGEVLTGLVSGATCTTTSTATYNGAPGNSGTTGSPKRSLAASLSSGGTGTKEYYILKGDTSNPSFYGFGDNDKVPSAMSTWATFKPDTGLTSSDIHIAGDDGSINAPTLHPRIHAQDVTFVKGLRAGALSGVALWTDNCVLTSPQRTVATALWIFRDFTSGDGNDGLYTTDCYHHDLSSVGLDEITMARNVHLFSVNEDGIRDCFLAMEIYLEDNDSADGGAHEDAFQFRSIVDANRIYYNSVLTDIATEQMMNCDDVDGSVMVNILAMAGSVIGAQFSQYGALGYAHIINNFFLSHITFVNSNLANREGQVGSVDTNNFLRYSVLPGMDGGIDNERTHSYLHNHYTNLVDDGSLNATFELDGNPWVGGVSALTADNPLTRDYHPSSATIKNRIPAGERYVAYDLFGTAVPNDGTGAIGALQSVIIVLPETPIAGYLKNKLNSPMKSALKNILY